MTDEVPCSKCGKNPTRPNWICDACALAELPENFQTYFFGGKQSMPRLEYTPADNRMTWPVQWLRRAVAKLFGLVEPTAIEADDAPETSILAKTYGDVVARVVRVHDGDTLTVSIDCWPEIVGTGIQVRLFGYDAPELKDPRPAMAELAGSARDYVSGVLRPGALVTLKNLRRDKYFRLLAGIHFADGSDLGQRLYTLGLARCYTGRGPKPW